ncbi:MAG: site-2 protease family protein [Patescibacteria group bacterium]
MFDQLFNNPLGVIYWLVALVVAITVHEFAHAAAAERLGDPTPRLMGRLTLNPLAHLDPLGTLMLLIARFGWGKPVVFDPFNLRHPRRDSAIISLAGPATNLVAAAIASLLLNLLFSYRLSLIASPIGLLTYLLMGLLKPIIILNVILAVFNLVPIHPLDGFKIVGGILPEEYARQWQELEPYGLIFLLFLIFPVFGYSPISSLISPVINFILNLLLPAVPLI